MSGRASFDSLASFLLRIPSVKSILGSGHGQDGRWWIKLQLDLSHPLVWRAIQELGHVLNYISLEESLPTVFMPVSPPPYLTGGPGDHLAWVIEAKEAGFSPDDAANWLEGRLPTPVDDPEKWVIEADWGRPE